MLYGFSFLYGAAGSTELTTILGVFEASGEAMERIQWLNRLALVLVVAGLGFKITAVPFHFYAPDVYEGNNARQMPLCWRCCPDRRLRGHGADRRGVDVGLGKLRLADRVDPGHADNDAGQLLACGRATSGGS